MGVDAEMVVELVGPVELADVRRWSYRLAEAVGPESFMVDGAEDLAQANHDGRQPRRAMNLYVAGQPDKWGEIGDSRLYGIVARAGHSYLWVSFCGRYYGPSYERGNPWIYIATAEWCERNLPGARVYYGGDSHESLEAFDWQARERLVSHWATHGGIPYHGGHWITNANPMSPTCPLCGEAAAQFGSGAEFASWACLGCSRHWVWVKGYDVPKMFDGRVAFDSFEAAKEMRAALESGKALDAVDPVVREPREDNDEG